MTTWRSPRRALFAALLALAAARPSAAQIPDDRPHGFLTTQYDSHTSSLIYIGYQVGPVTPVVGLVADPHGTYREHLIGVLRTERLPGGASVSAAVAAARALDAWYGQLYLLPSVSLGRLSYDATFEVYVPLEARGVRQANMNPGNLMYGVSDHLAAGAVAVWADQRGAPHVFGAGPSLRWRGPKGSIALDGVLGVRRWESEWRVTFFAAY